MVLFVIVSINKLNTYEIGILIERIASVRILFGNRFALNLDFSFFSFLSFKILAEWLRASGCQCQSRHSPGFDPSVPRLSGIWWAADKAVLNNEHRKKKSFKNPPSLYLIKYILFLYCSLGGQSYRHPTAGRCQGVAQGRIAKEFIHVSASCLFCQIWRRKFDTPHSLSSCNTIPWYGQNDRICV